MTKGTRPGNILTAPSHTPICVSPIVVHDSKTTNNNNNNRFKNGNNSSNNNWMRKQWIANLKKKTNGGSNTTTLSSSSSPETTTSDNKSNSTWVKRLYKKRGNKSKLSASSASDTEDRPHTPRRKLNSGAAFEDFDAQHNLHFSNIDVSWFNTTNTTNTTSNIMMDDNCFAPLFDTRCLDDFDIITSSSTTNNAAVSNNDTIIPLAVTKQQAMTSVLQPPPSLVRSSSDEALSAYLDHAHINTPPHTAHQNNNNNQGYREFRAMLDDCVSTDDIDKELESFYFDDLSSNNNSESLTT